MFGQKLKTVTKYYFLFFIYRLHVRVCSVRHVKYVRVFKILEVFNRSRRIKFWQTSHFL
jgi:hypothetical protein